MTEFDGAIAALRAARVDPVRLCVVEALARRATGQGGAARRRLDARLATLIAGLQARLDDAPTSAGAAADAPPRAPGPLVALAALATRQRHTMPPGAPGSCAVAPAVAEASGLGYMRATWARLSAEQRLAQSLAHLPDNAGPLNSQHLVHRSLALMHELSPACLQHFLAQMDGLMWLEQVNRKKGILTEKNKQVGSP